MSDFDPGEGWREVHWNEAAVPRRLALYDDTAGPARWFVPVAPVPPLPTEPNTVVRVAYRETGRSATLVRRTDGEWRDLDTGMKALDPDHVGFEVLAAPRGEWSYTNEDIAALKERVRRETAEAVLDRVYPWIFRPTVKNLDYWNTEIEKLAREFGTKS